MLERLRRARGDEGQTSIEYVALVLLVAAALAIGAILVPGSLRHTVLAGVKGGIATATCRVTGGACPQPGGGAGVGDGGDGGGGPAVSAQDPSGQPGGQPNGRPDGQPTLDPQPLPYENAAPADNLQLAAYQLPPGDGGGNLGGQAGRLPTGGNYPFVPKKGQRLDKPKTLTRHDGRFVDKYGNEWQWDPVKGEWDVQHSDGTHTNIGEDGEITHGDDNFPKQPKAKGGNQGAEDSGSSESGGGDDKGGDTAKSVAIGVGAGVGIGGLLWWGAKVLSPACGPFVVVCAVVF